MVVAIASAVLTMACQGCVAVSPHDQARIEPAVPPTVGMMMAAPGTAGAMPERADISVHVVDGLPTRFTGTPLGLGSRLAARAFAGTPADFSSGTFVTSSLATPELTWSGTSALTAIAAERSASATYNPALAKVERHCRRSGLLRTA